ncbi:MAG TPA: alginate lyase family protein, partial [Gemmatimonadaceae bacterium]|nr:alginate lyase family protein [Gemmatimonadaceae bacterium]
LVDPEDTAREFQHRFPAAAAAIIAAADRIVAGEVDLGNRVVSIGARPDWTLEPLSGKRAPAIHWSRIPFLDPCVAGDCKHTWELNRHQYFVTLGRAYSLTCDDRYATLIADHISSWIEDNPPKIGINWTSSLELALRAISWIWALSLVRNSPRLDGHIYRRLLKALHLHARHIEHNLSTYFSPNTHITGEALGLLYIGGAFPELKRAAHWRALGARILAAELDRQLFADGVYFEQSTYYHRYTADFYLHALLLTQSTEPWLQDIVRPKLGRLLDYLLFTTRPDGTSPLIGDDDGGRLVLLGDRAANDFRDTLALGAAVLERGDCAHVAGRSVPELLWLLGPSGLRGYESLTATPPAHSSRGFTESGYFVMRDSWDRGADWAVVRCGPHAPATGAHAHADALALELSVAGNPLLIDPGTYVYTASREEREYFRGTAAHNTLTIDERSSAEPGRSVFKWQSVPRSRVTSWVTNATLDFFEGEHDGYSRLDPPAVHSRATFFLKGEYWVIRDRVRSNGAHRLALHFHWAPGITLCAEGEHTLTAHFADANAPRVSARIFGAARCGQLSSEQGWVSPAYGSRTPAPISVFRVDAEGTQELVTLLARSTASLRLHECEWSAPSERDAGMLTIATASHLDTLLTGPMLDGGPNELVSDASWTWLRHSLDGQLVAFALVDGRNLTIDNTPVFQADRPVDCAIGRPGPDGWRVDVQSGNRLSMITPPSTISQIEEPCAASVE